MIEFSKCDPEERSTCKSEHEIEEFLKRKFIAIVSNQRRFVQELDIVSAVDSVKTTIISEAKLIWIPLDSRYRRDEAYVIKVTELSLNDKLLRFSNFFEEEESIFTIEKKETRPYEFNNTV